MRRNCATPPSPRTTTNRRIRARQLAQLKDTLDQLNANLKAGRASLDALTIRAPVDGRLTALDAQTGQSKTKVRCWGRWIRRTASS